MSLELAQHHQALWERYLAAITAYSSAVVGIRNEDAAEAAEPRDFYYGPYSRYEPYEHNRQIKKVAREVIHELTNAAETAFAPPGTRLRISAETYRERFIDPITGHDNDHPMNWERFSPRAVWCALEEEFGGQNGVEESYRQAAPKLIEFFGIRPSQPIKNTGRYVVLSHRVWGEVGLSWDAQNDIQEGSNALVIFAKWAAVADLAATAGYIASEHNQQGRGGGRANVTSRARYSRGPALEVVTYYARFEYRFAPAVAERLQVFIATFSNLQDLAA